jgi:hypothetical protein
LRRKKAAKSRSGISSAFTSGQAALSCPMRSRRLPFPSNIFYFLSKKPFLSLRFPKEHAILKEQGYITP